MKLTLNAKRVFAVAAASLVFAAIRTYIVFSNFVFATADTKEYYLAESPACTVFGIVFALSCVAFVAMGAFFGYKKSAFSKPCGNFAWVSAVAVLASLAVFCVAALSAALEDLRDCYVSTSVGEALKYLLLYRGVAVSVIGVIAGIMMVFATAKSKTNGEAASALTLGIIVFSGIRLLFAFMLHSATPYVNSGTYNILSLSALLLFFLCDGKACIGRGSAALYNSFGYLSVMLTAVYAIPDLFVRAAGKLPFDIEGASSVVSLCLTLAATARLIMLPSRLEPFVKNPSEPSAGHEKENIRVVKSVNVPQVAFEPIGEESNESSENSNE